MTSLKRELPSLNTLATFEAAARLASFTRAGHELHITQAAVSRQILRLERHLGTRLFHRGHGGLSLTGAGERLFEAVGDGLGEIARGVRRVRMADADAPVTLSATIAFSNFWLMPRLRDFRQHHPDIDVRILADDRDLDPTADDVDIAITFGEEQTIAGQQRRLLGWERIVPVCAPGYRERRPKLAHALPADLATEELLHLDPEHWTRLRGHVIDWPVWLEHFGVRVEAPLSGLRFNNYPMLLDATLAGQGIALGWRPVVDDLLASGRLVRVGQSELPTRRGYWATIATERPLPLLAQRVHEWLVSQTEPGIG